MIFLIFLHLCLDMHFFYWQKEAHGLGHNLSTLLSRQSGWPPSFARCFAFLRIAPQVMETHKRRKEDTLKYLNLAKINKLRYSFQFIGCPNIFCLLKNSLVLQRRDFKAADSFAQSKAPKQSYYV